MTFYGAWQVPFLRGKPGKPNKKASPMAWNRPRGAGPLAQAPWGISGGSAAFGFLFLPLLPLSALLGAPP